MNDTGISDATQSTAEWSNCIVDALVANGSLSVEQGAAALVRAETSGTSVRAVLAMGGLVDAATSLRCLAAVSGLTVLDLGADPPNTSARACLSPALARRHGAIGLRLDRGQLTLACAEPLRAEQIREIATATGTEVVGCVLAEATEIERLIAESEPAVDAHAPLRIDSGEPSAQRGGIRALEVSEERVVPLRHYRLEAEEADDEASPGAAADHAMRTDRGATSAAIAGLSRAPTLNELLVRAVDSGASDLHLACDFPPAVRVDGAIRRMEGQPLLDNDSIRELVYSILPQSARERFEATKELDTSHSVHGVGRFRVSVFQQRGHVGAVLRMIPSEIPSFSTLGLPPALASFAEMRRGLVLVTGPTGSGKSTTLASIIDIINQEKPLHIMTVEDPIEFVYSSASSIVNQREVGLDTESFAESLRHVLRQDPDVILVGEMRDLETISMALTAAETGHLVFSTLHTQDAPQTLDRIIDVFPTAQQEQVRTQLASALQAVVTQQLLLAADGVGRVPVAEVMFCTPAVRNLIRTGKAHQLYSLMQTGGKVNMQTMDQALARAVKAGAITKDMALDRCHDRNELADYLKA